MYRTSILGGLHTISAVLYTLRNGLICDDCVSVVRKPHMHYMQGGESCTCTICKASKKVWHSNVCRESESRTHASVVIGCSVTCTHRATIPVSFPSIPIAHDLQWHKAMWQMANIYACVSIASHLSLCIAVGNDPAELLPPAVWCVHVPTNTSNASKWRVISNVTSQYMLVLAGRTCTCRDTSDSTG